MAGTAVRLAPAGETISCGSVRVSADDIGVADHDGIVVLDPATAIVQLTAAAEVMATEARAAQRSAQGATLNGRDHGHCGM